MSLVKTSKMLRHANPQVTATFYADLTEEQTQELGTELFGAASS